MTNAYDVKDEIMKVLDRMDISTARGRMESRGQAVSLKPNKDEIINAAENRARAYRYMSRDLADMISHNRNGLPAKELEMAEFVREQLADLASKAYDLVLKQY